MRWLLIFFIMMSRVGDISANNLAYYGAYDFSFTKLNGDKLLLDQFNNKFLMLINIPNICSNSNIKLYELQKLYENYHSYGFEIIAIPTDDFSNTKSDFDFNDKNCHLDQLFSYYITKPLRITGDHADPFFKWLKTRSTAKISDNFYKIFIEDAEITTIYPDRVEIISDMIVNKITSNFRKEDFILKY